MNRVCMVGRVATDPEMAYTQSGIAVTTFRIAVRDPFRKDEQGKYHTDFFDVKAWRQTAEFAANYLVKGNQIAVQGKLCVDEWENDGQKRRRYYVQADAIDNLGRRMEPPAAVATAAGAHDHQPEEEFIDPFAND